MSGHYDLLTANGTLHFKIYLKV